MAVAEIKTSEKKNKQLIVETLEAQTGHFKEIHVEKITTSSGSSNGFGQPNKAFTFFMMMLPIATFFLGYFYGQLRSIGTAGAATGPKNFNVYAKTAGINVKKFEQCMNSGEFKDEVTADLNFAQSVSATGTPTFFINGQIMVGALPYEAFQQVIDATIANDRSAVVEALKPYQAPDEEGNPGEVPDAVSDSMWQQIISPAAAVEGQDSAPVTLVEFTDFQCPYCSRHYTQTYITLKQNYVDTGKVKHITRDLPLPFHQNAHKAAEAARCAGAQNKYWEMYNLLFTNQNEWSNWTI